MSFKLYYKKHNKKYYKIILIYLILNIIVKE